MKTQLNAKHPDQVLTVYVDDKTFGIPIYSIQDVLKAQSMTYVPLANRCVRGVMNLRGRIVTVIDLSAYLGLTPDISSGPMNVVMESGTDLFSLLVDRVGDVIKVDKTFLDELPLTLDPSWRVVTSHVYGLPDSLMVFIDPEKLFSSINTESL